MECLYLPALTETSQRARIEGDEAAHARALRLRRGEAVLLSNGAGLAAKAELLEDASPSGFLVAVQSLEPERGELPFSLVAALGVLDNRERMEFALEKAVELGARCFAPLASERAAARERSKPNRYRAKALAAMKQCGRARLTDLLPAQTPEELLRALPPDAVVVLADAEGDAPPATLSSNAPLQTLCVCVGPEGGFSDAERERFRRDARIRLWRLAPVRLRAETALIAALSVVSTLAMK
jgi:16S rRNA (uracil1498-N3)-methyltransferase